jgi:phage terminase large subunit
MKLKKKKIKITKIGEKNYNGIINDNIRIIANQGSTRSGKTFNIIIVLISLALTTQNLTISVVAETLPHLKRGAMRDFLSIMQTNNIYNAKRHNKTDYMYRFENGSYIEFFSADNGDKLRGSSRDILFINECNLIKQEAFLQLNMRTRKKVIIDYNPADEFHWIYDDILPRSDALYIHSTYKDNIMFLTKSQISEIEKLKDIDENFWKVYGLGERGTAQEVVYTHYKIEKNFPDEFDMEVYGLDFGFNNPSAFVKIGIKDNIYYVQELLFQSGLTNNELIQRIKSFNIGNSIIYADSAEPARIEEFKRAGFWIKPAVKDVNDGIDHIKTLDLRINYNSTNLIKELSTYKYKVKNGYVLDAPVKLYDHLLDATRYGIYTHYKKGLKQPQFRVIG